MSANDKVNIDDDLDALFKLPLTEFTAARNALAARLKKNGRGDDAERVKSLPKPSSSAWAVNQLYWKHRDAFNRLIATGERFGRAQSSQHTDKTADMRAALAERREALSDLTRITAGLLRDAGHNPTPDTLRRVTTTLEALSTGSTSSTAASADAPPGRLTQDIGPPGFDSLAGFIPSGDQPERPRESTRVIPFKPAMSGRKREDLRQAKIVEAKAALETAERVLRETQSMAHDLAAALKEARDHAEEMEKNRREAEDRFEKAKLAASEARHRLQGINAEATKTAKLLENAQRALAKAQDDLGKIES